MQSKQNLWVHPLIDATSVKEGGASRQIAQVKSANWTGSSAAATSATGTSFAAGFKSMPSMSSSSSTMGDPFGTGGSPVLAFAPTVVLAVAVPTLVDADVSGVMPPFIPMDVPSLFRMLLLLAKRVERRWGASSSAIRVVAMRAARRVDRLEVAGGVVIPIEKEGVAMFLFVPSQTRII